MNFFTKKKAAVLCAAVTAAVLFARGRNKKDLYTPNLGFLSALQRDSQMVKLGAKAAGRYGVYRAKKKFSSEKRQLVLDEKFQMQTAADVTKELGHMKGAMMKIGQVASYLDTGLPDHVRTTLASLQSDSPPMSGALAAQQIEKSFGQTPDKLFHTWDETPIAAASIGQVHKAVTHEGDAVAVKIQYPGIKEVIASDLTKADWLFKAISVMFPGLDPDPIVVEIRSRLSEELDYVLEAKNQDDFHSYFDGHPYINVPKVHHNYCTQTVLTSDLVVGYTFDEVCQWSQDERNLLSETLYRFSFGSIYQLASFNGDPHPGNYIFHKGGKVTFLDFGLVKKFNASETQLFEDLIQKMVLHPDKKVFRKLVEDASILAPDAPFSDELVEEYFRFYYEYVLQDAVTVIDETYAERGVAHLFDMKGPYGELMKNLNVPPALVVVQRITLGLMGIFAKLNATANWQQISRELWPFVENGPSTPMGEKIAAWRTSIGQEPVGV